MMKLNELLKVIYNIQGIKVYKGENLLYTGTPKKLNDENLLEREVKSVFTLYDEVDDFNESYIIIAIF